MSSPVIIEAKSRSDMGKGASRRLRREGLLPGVVYGGTSPSCSITLSQNQIWLCSAKDWFYSHILDLKVDDKIEKVLIKDMQRHPYKPVIIHVDFQRVLADQKIMPRIPIHFVGEEGCIGLKAGGTVVRDILDVEIICLPGDLPESFVVDITNLDVGESIHLSDLVLPEGVEQPDLLRDNDQVIVSVIKARSVAEDDEAEAEDDENEESDGSEE